MPLNVVRSNKLDAKLLITYYFKLAEMLKAYETFEHAVNSNAIEVNIDM